MPKGASCILTNWPDSQGVSNTQLVDQEFPSCLALGVFDENWTKNVLVIGDFFFGETSLA